MNTIRELIGRFDANLPVYDVQTMEAVVDAVVAKRLGARIETAQAAVGRDPQVSVPAPENADHVVVRQAIRLAKVTPRAGFVTARRRLPVV